MFELPTGSDWMLLTPYDTHGQKFSGGVLTVSKLSFRRLIIGLITVVRRLIFLKLMRNVYNPIIPRRRKGSVYGKW